MITTTPQAPKADLMTDIWSGEGMFVDGFCSRILVQLVDMRQVLYPVSYNVYVQL